MTWPFENDTSGIVKRISNRSISANRKRNIFIVLTIALASALLRILSSKGRRGNPGTGSETAGAEENQRQEVHFCGEEVHGHDPA